MSRLKEHKESGNTGTVLTLASKAVDQRTSTASVEEDVDPDTELVITQADIDFVLSTVIKPKRRGKKRKDGNEYGISNQPGYENWFPVVQCFPLSFETFRDYLKAKMMVMAFRFMLQRLMDLACGALRMGCTLEVKKGKKGKKSKKGKKNAEGEDTEGGELHVRMDPKRSERIMELLTTEDLGNGSPYYGLKGEWVRLANQLAKDKEFPIDFKTSVWDDARVKLAAILKTKDIRKGNISRKVLHVNMERAVPEVKHATLPIMGYRSRREFYPFWEINKDHPDGLMDKFGFDLFFEAKRAGCPKPEPLRVLCHGPFKGKDGKMYFRELNDSSMNIFNHLLISPHVKVNLRSETADGRRQTLYMPASTIPEKGDESRPLPWEHLLGDDAERNKRIRAYKQRPWEYVKGELRLDRKGKFFFDVTYYRPPTSRVSKVDERSAYVFIKNVKGEGKREGLHYQIHLMMEKTTPGKEKMDKWRTYSLPVNNIVRRLEQYRRRRIELTNLIQSCPDRHSVDYKRLNEKLKELTKGRQNLVEKEIRMSVRTLLRRLLPWACGNLRLTSLPAEHSPEELLGGIESFPWAFFEGALKHRCGKLGVKFTGPSTDWEKCNAAKENAVAEIRANKKLSDEERKSELAACNKKFAAVWQAISVSKEDIQKELEEAVVEYVKKLGAKKKKEKEEGDADSEVGSSVPDAPPNIRRHRGPRAAVKKL